ncbi:MAG: type 4a pilus biogenesis protein PilO [Myxococcota bacterium]
MAATAPKDTSFDGLPLVAKAFLLLLILALLTVVYYLALHMSLADEIDAAEAKHGQLEQRLREAEQRQQRFLQLSQELANREAIDRRNKMTLPEKAEIAAFLQDLNRLAELSGLRIRMVEPRPEEAEELYVRLPVSLELTGRYHQLMKFFYKVSRIDRAINMENITLGNAREAEEDDEFVLDASVLATTFRRPTEEPEGDGDASDEDAAGARPGGSG